MLGQTPQGIVCSVHAAGALATWLTRALPVYTLQEAYERSSTLLKTHAHELHALASALIESETLSGEQIKTLLTSIKSTSGDGQSTSSTEAAASSVAAAS